jgi:hypothetical protein
MGVLQLSSVKIGTPSIPLQWSNEQQKHVKYDFKRKFIDEIKYSNHQGLYKYNEPDTTVKYELDTIEPDSKFYHRNYLNYLEKCWADHLGIVITPDIFWYTLLSEFATLVKGDPENYRGLFTDSPEKKEIIVVSGSLTVMPLDVLVDALKRQVPSDTSLYFPDLSFTKNSDHAFLASFCDICSPYYNYSMYLCGFPFIDVKGSIEDWKLLKEHWDRLKKIVKGNIQWVNTVSNIFNNIVEQFDNKDFWKGIFSLKHCGSGHQAELSGWFTDLFVVQPRVRYAENFSAHVSNIKYKQLDTNQDFEMSVGLFNSIQRDEFMEPSFSFIVYNTTGGLV